MREVLRRFHRWVGRIPLAVLYVYYLLCVGAFVLVFVKLVDHATYVAAFVGLASGLLVATLMTAFERISRAA
jgi:hypothetical protein